jgi:hypothetical protein
MCILICCVFAGTGKPDTRGYPPGAGTGSIFYPRAHSQAGKGRRHGYARGRVNVLPAHTQPAAIPTPGDILIIGAPISHYFSFINLFFLTLRFCIHRMRSTLPLKFVKNLFFELMKNFFYLFLQVYYGVKCTSGPQTCARVSYQSTNSKSVSSRSLNTVRVSLRSKRISIMSTNSQSVSLRSICANMKCQHG